MATVANCRTLTNTSGTNEISTSAQLSEKVTRESLGAFSVEGTHKEPTSGQVWPRLA